MTYRIKVAVQETVGFSIKPHIGSLTSFGNIERVPANLGDIGTNPIDVLLKANVQSRAASPFDLVRYISVAFLRGSLFLTRRLTST